MGDKSKIEWLHGGATWNPIRARNRQTGKRGWFCAHASPGCVNCYAERMNVGRFGNGVRYAVDQQAKVEIYLDEKTLLQPLKWKRGRLIFPCSMTDWMESSLVPSEWIDRMVAVMALTPQHTYLTLTKRADHQLQYFNDRQLWDRTIRWMRTNVLYCAQVVAEDAHQKLLEQTPLKNLWPGVSVENQQYADERIPLLLQTPAAVRWVSFEPLLGPIKLPPGYNGFRKMGDGLDYKWAQPFIDWAVVGGESGPKARPMHPSWVRSLRDQCVAAGVPFFFKQHGEWMPIFHGINPSDNDPKCRIRDGFTFPPQAGDPKQDGIPIGQHMWKVGKKAAGRLLDGRTWDEYPEVSRG